MGSKIDLNFEVVDSKIVSPSMTLLKLRPFNGATLPPIFPGQFLNIFINHSQTFLRRPISICNYDSQKNEIWIMVKKLGKGSEILCNSKVGDTYDIILPLGKGFSLPTGDNNGKILLIGGGVGIAPLYFFGQWLAMLDIKFTLLTGARSKNELTFIDEFKELCDVNICTDNGEEGFKGVVTDHPIMNNEWTRIYSCGPLPMMKAVAKVAVAKHIKCEVSLENRMACGIGACLCCVEQTVDGNQCVCTQGPVFNIEDLKWQN